MLAHDTSTLPRGRVSDYYGETPHAWNPYHPAHSRPLANYAVELAKKCLDCEPLLEAFAGGRPPWNAKEQSPPGLFLVDAWVSLSEPYQERLSQLNQISEPWVSILIPWNNQDAGLSSRKNRFGTSCTGSGPETGWRAPTLPYGGRRHSHIAGLHPAAAGNDHAHAEEIPERCASPSA